MMVLVPYDLGAGTPHGRWGLNSETVLPINQLE